MNFGTLVSWMIVTHWLVSSRRIFVLIILDGELGSNLGPILTFITVAYEASPEPSVLKVATFFFPSLKWNGILLLR